MGDVVTITGASARRRIRVLRFALPSCSYGPSFPFYPIQTKVRLFVLHWQGLLQLRAFFFISAEQVAWGIGITV